MLTWEPVSWVVEDEGSSAKSNSERNKNDAPAVPIEKPIDHTFADTLGLKLVSKFVSKFFCL